MSSMQIRWMIRRDMPSVLAIEEASFEFPWSEEDFIKYLRQSNCIGMTVGRDDEVVGFMMYELHKTRIDLINIAVHPSFRRQGFGKMMIDRLESRLINERHHLTLDVRETNLPAQLFFRASGFRATEVIKDLYTDTNEDGYFMELTAKEEAFA